MTNSIRVFLILHFQENLVQKLNIQLLVSGLLGHILTLKSNMSSFDKLLEHNILNVLGMNDTSIGLSDSQKSRLAVGHFNGQELPTLNFSSPIAPGGGASFDSQ